MQAKVNFGEIKKDPIEVNLRVIYAEVSYLI